MNTQNIFLNKEFEREWNVEMVIIPKEMALDLIRYLSKTGCFIAEMSDAQCEADMHESAAKSNSEKMEKLYDFVNDRLCVSSCSPTAASVLSTMASIYEGSGLMNALDRKGA